MLSIGTILGCLLAPFLAERFGRRKTLAGYFAGMAAAIFLAFGWAFYLPNGLTAFIAVLFFLGVAGGNFAIFSLWLPEQYDTAMRATAFAFCTSFGRFLGPARISPSPHSFNGPALWVHVIALTAIPFVLGLAVIPFAVETRGKALP